MSQTKAQLIDNLVQALNFTGTASAPANGAFLSATNTLALATNSAQRLTIDSSGRVMIGTTTAAAFSNRQLSVSSSSGTTSIELRSATNGDGRIIFTDSTDSSNAGAYKCQIKYLQGSDDFIISSNGDNERLRIDSSGRVGIGTTSPQKLLDVRGEFAISNSNASYWDFDRDDSDGSLKIKDTGTERMRIDSSGRVHIGTSTNRLGETLHVLGSGIVTSSAENTNMMIFGTFGTSNAIIGSFNSIPLLFRTGNTERMRIDSSGRVLVGTTDTPSKLTVDTDFCVVRSSSDPTINLLLGSSSSITQIYRILIDDSDSDKLQVRSGDTPRITMTTGGFVGIGQTNPSQPLHVLSTTNPAILARNDSGGTGIRMQSDSGSACSLSFSDLDAHNQGLVMYHHADDRMQFNTAGSERMRIDSSGNVLVGTTTARGLGKLEIEGTSFENSGLTLVRNVNSTGATSLNICKSRGGIGSVTSVANNDVLGGINFRGADGANLKDACDIRGEVDGTPSQGSDMPGRLVFRTSADGSSSPTERMRIDSSGQMLMQGGNIQLTQQGNSINTTNGQIGGGNSSQGNNSRITFNTEGAVNQGNITFHTMTGGTDVEVFRIDKNQHFLFKATSSGQVGIMMFPSSTSPYQRVMHGGSGSSFANHTLIEFRSTVDGVIGEIKQDGDGTITYATSSDYRLKENIVDLTGAITRLKNLKPKRFNFKKNASMTKDGFLAHELQEVIPEAVNGTKDEVVTEDSKANVPHLKEEEVGNPIYQTADLARVVPLLTATLQEAITKIETLETKVAALEAA